MRLRSNRSGLHAASRCAWFALLILFLCCGGQAYEAKSDPEDVAVYVIEAEAPLGFEVIQVVEKPEPGVERSGSGQESHDRMRHSPG